MEMLTFLASKRVSTGAKQNVLKEKTILQQKQRKLL